MVSARVRCCCYERHLQSTAATESDVLHNKIALSRLDNAIVLSRWQTCCCFASYTCRYHHKRQRATPIRTYSRFGVNVNMHVSTGPRYRAVGSASIRSSTFHVPCGFADELPIECKRRTVTKLCVSCLCLLVH